MKTGIIYIHGIGLGNQTGFSKNFQKYLNTYLPNCVSHEINWKQYTQLFEKKLINNYTPAPRYKILRNIFSELVGDAEAYSSMGSVYKEIHVDLFNKINLLIKQKVDKIHIVGHSLGTIIIYNFLWDALNESSSGNMIFKIDEITKKTLLQKIENIFLIASPLSVWSSRWNDGGLALNLNSFENFNNLHNIYSKYDVVAWPISKINDSYKQQSKIKDINLNYGKILGKYTPMAHTQCWDDLKIAKYIKSSII